MTAFADARVGMRAQVAEQIQGAGVRCNVLRFNPTTDATGKKTGSYTSLVSGGVNEIMWIQPIGGGSDIQDEGLNAETTHYVFQAHEGVALVAKDRILPSGETYAYDVLQPNVLETHRRAELKQVLRV
jgi:hypothetical protein